MRILFISDSIYIPTGLAKVGRELSMGLAKKGHQIGYINLYHRKDSITHIPPGMICWFTNNNCYGSDVIDSAIIKFRPDILITIGDMWNFAYITDSNICRTRRLFQWCAYISCDGEPFGGGIPPALVPVIEDVDIPIAYTDYAKEMILKSCHDSETRLRLKTIYHGVDASLFKPLDWEERRKLRAAYGIDDKLMFLTVCRNQSRKNIPEMFKAWKIFSAMDEARGNVIFWPHMYFNDPAGWKIGDLLEILKLRNNSIMYYNEVAYAPSEMHLISEIELVKLYQIADVFLLISGEGFGLPTFEAMAANVPCILLDYAASSELGAGGRAELVPVNDSITWTGMHLTQRPIPDSERIVDAMLKLYRNKNLRNDIANKGHEFAVQFTWERICDEWNDLLRGIEIPFLKPLELEMIA